MRLPVRISFQNVASSNAISELVRQHAWDLQARFPRIGNCEVAIENPSGSQLKVRIDLSTPGRRLVVERAASATAGGNGTDAFGLIADAFEGARVELAAFAPAAQPTAQPLSPAAPAGRAAGSGSSPAA